MSVDGVTVHGFRSSFRDWAADNSAFHPETAELALAHSIPSATERSYGCGGQLDKRRELMAEWARFLCGGQPVIAPTTDGNAGA
jgi:integrase